jgi:NTP pyrophosphatase (non-canonical NTP hydrolase)
MGQGHKLDVDKLRDELGDVCWYIAAACEVLGLDMGNVMGANICKLKKRFPSGFTTEASVARADVDPRQLTVEGT